MSRGEGWEIGMEESGKREKDREESSGERRSLMEDLTVIQVDGREV